MKGQFLALAVVVSCGLIFSSTSHGGDVYGVLRDPAKPDKKPGICSADINTNTGEVYVSATANNLKNKRAYSSWVFFTIDGETGSPVHLDGTIAGRGQSYKFQGRFNLGEEVSLLQNIEVELREHPKVKGNESDETIIDFVTSPNGGCDGVCPVPAECDMQVE